MFVVFIAAAVTAANLPHRHFYGAQEAVANAVTCVSAPNRDASGLTSRLRGLEALGRSRGLQLEIDRQKRELRMHYMSSLRIPCAGGREKAFHDARVALRKLEQFLAARRG